MTPRPPVPSAATAGEREPWDRRNNETAAAYVAFRRFRDFGPLRKLDQVADDRTRMDTLRQWRDRHDWLDRAKAWDDELHRTEDRARIEAIRWMHERHQQAGRAAMEIGLAALARVDVADIPPYAAARLLDLGAKLERETLTTSVEEMQGIEPARADDPWETIARELDSVPDLD